MSVKGKVIQEMAVGPNEILPKMFCSVSINGFSVTIEYNKGSDTWIS